MDNKKDYSISKINQKIYSQRLFFSPKDAAAIMLNIDPKYVSSRCVRDMFNGVFDEVFLLKEVIIEQAGAFKNVVEEWDINNIPFIEKIDAQELKQWALSNDYFWLNENQPTSITQSENSAQINALQKQLDQANAKNAELIAELEQLRVENQNLKKPEPQPSEPLKQERTQAHHRALFALLVEKNFTGFDTRNSLFNAINSELKAKGITTKNIKPDTFYKLIDDDLPIAGKIFPPKRT